MGSKRKVWPPAAGLCASSLRSTAYSRATNLDRLRNYLGEPGGSVRGFTLQSLTNLVVSFLNLTFSPSMASRTPMFKSRCSSTSSASSSTQAGGSGGTRSSGAGHRNACGIVTAEGLSSSSSSHARNSSLPKN